MLEAAVLVEANWLNMVDHVWVTVVPPEVAKQRIMKRNNLTEDEALKRIASQISNEERTKHANVIIDTTGTFEETRAKIEHHWKELKRVHFPHSTL